MFKSNGSAMLKAVSLVLAFIILCAPLSVSASSPRAIVLPDPIGDGDMENYLFTITANEVHDFLRSSRSIVLDTLPSGADTIYYAGCLNTTASDNPNYNFRTGVCYYNEFAEAYFPITYYEPTHGEYFSYDETAVSVELFEEFEHIDRFYGFIRNRFPMDTDYVSGYVSFYAVERR